MSANSKELSPGTIVRLNKTGREAFIEMLPYTIEAGWISDAADSAKDVQGLVWGFDDDYGGYIVEFSVPQGMTTWHVDRSEVEVVRV